MHAAQNSLPATPSSCPVPLALIAAVAANGVIGDRNRLPWRLPEDLRRFRAITTGHAVIMGRKTWESLPAPLPGRQSIVVTRDPDYPAAGADVATTLEQALALVRLPAPAFCIGGGELYRVAFPLADLLYLTEIERDYPGDVTFPSYDRDAWREISREPRQGEGPDAFTYSFVTRERRGA